jgi:hypothetical protein
MPAQQNVLKHTRLLVKLRSSHQFDAQSCMHAHLRILKDLRISQKVMPLKSYKKFYNATALSL